MFITFEGLDYSGKSTQVKLLTERLLREGFHVTVERDPGGTEIGERIRSILLDKQTMDMAEVTELLLFSASRSQLIHEIVKPALQRGEIVILDRFYDSTTAYQGWGRGISLEAIEAINRCAADGLVPDITFFIDIPIEEVERRIQKMQGGKDRMESNGREFYKRIRQGYLELAKKQPRIHIIDGMQQVEHIHSIIWSHVHSRVPVREKRST